MTSINLRSILIYCSFYFITISNSFAIECPHGKGIYRGTVNQKNEIRLFDKESGQMIVSNGKNKTIYDFSTTVSNNYSRLYFVLKGKNAPSSVVMEFGPDFKASKNAGHSDFIVLPEIRAGVYYFGISLGKSVDKIDLPDDAYILTGCADKNSHNPMKSNN